VDSNIYLPFKTRKKGNNKIKDKKVGGWKEVRGGREEFYKERVEEVVEGELLFLIKL
jgi:hypothetical protein